MSEDLKSLKDGAAAENDKSSVHPILRMLWNYRPTLIVILTPIILLPLPLLVPGTEAACGYCILLMGVYWLTEVLPTAVTGLLPIALFPLWGIMSAGAVSTTYFSDIQFLGMGGFMIAIAVVKTGLHRRASLIVLTSVGANPRCLIFGVMITTFLLSMLISNTAVTAMMLPIVQAVVDILTEDDDNETENEIVDMKDETVTSFAISNPAYEKEDCDETSVKLSSEQDQDIKDDKWKTAIKKSMTICVPYAATIGGTGSLTGSGPTLVLVGQFQEIFPDAPDLLSYPRWMMYSLPCAFVFLLTAYVWISNFHLGFSLKDIFGCLTPGKKSRREEQANQLLRDEYKKLGSIRWDEGTVLIVFLITILLWFFRAPGFITGWEVLFKDDYVKDGTTSILMASLLFFLPKEKPHFLRSSSEIATADKKPVESILQWNSMAKVFPWDVIFLCGGGFAIASAAIESGLSSWLGDLLSELGYLDDWVILLVITTVLSLFTEITSNTATSSLFIPILAALAVNLEIHPLYLLVPLVLATSLAFMLPIATPPNAVAFGYGHLRIIDTVKCGFVLNCLGILFVNLFINTYGIVYFELDEFPSWANITI